MEKDSNLEFWLSDFEKNIWINVYIQTVNEGMYDHTFLLKLAHRLFHNIIKTHTAEFKEYTSKEILGICYLIICKFCLDEPIYAMDIKLLLDKTSVDKTSVDKTSVDKTSLSNLLDIERKILICVGHDLVRALKLQRLF